MLLHLDDTYFQWYVPAKLNISVLYSEMGVQSQFLIWSFPGSQFSVIYLPERSIMAVISHH